MAVCVILSLTVGILNGLSFPFVFGMYTRFSGDGLYILAFNSDCISVISASIPAFFNPFMVFPSMPGDTPFFHDGFPCMFQHIHSLYLILQ